MTEPRIPNVGEYVRGHGRLVEIQDVKPPLPPPPLKDYIFERVEARVEIRANGHVIDQKGTTWEFYGEGKAVEGAIDDARKYAAQYGSGVEVVVVKVTTRRRHVEGGENHHDRAFIGFKERDWGSAVGMPDPVEEDVWSSKNPEGSQ